MIRRPAAAVGVGRRPAANVRGRRRPSAVGEGDETPERREGEEGEGILGQYRSGALVEAVKVPPGSFRKGDWLVVPEGTYYQQTVALALRVEKEELEEGEREVIGELTGTKSEELLKFGTAQRPCRLRLHLCLAGCPQLRENPDLVHVRKLKKIRGEDQKTWEMNLQEEKETHLLQADEAEWRRRGEEAKKKGEERGGSTSSQSRRKKRKKKKKKGKKRERDEKGDQRSPAKVRLGGKTVAKKTLRALYEGTGLDPSVGHRKKVIKRVRKALKKTKDSSSSATSSSSTSSTDMEGDTLLSDRSKVHRIATLGPGILASQSVNQMKQFLTQITGSGWEEDSNSLPPILGLYNRTYMSSRLTGGVAREFTTLAWVGDLLLQARPAEALDSVCQRMKSIEMTSNGTAWSTSQKLELVPPADATMASRQEAQIAKKEAKLDQETKGGMTLSEKGRPKGRDKGGKGKEKGKGKAKENEGKKSS